MNVVHQNNLHRWIGDGKLFFIMHKGLVEVGIHEPS